MGAQGAQGVQAGRCYPGKTGYGGSQNAQKEGTFNADCRGPLNILKVHPKRGLKVHPKRVPMEAQMEAQIGVLEDPDGPKTPQMAIVVFQIESLRKLFVLLRGTQTKGRRK